MIFGIGTDIVENIRIKEALDAHGDHFAEKILTGSEMLEFKKSKKPVSSLAKYFAAKEAVVKAMGTGFKEGITHYHIIIDRKESGQPYIRFEGAAKAFIEKQGIKGSHLSLSDEREFTVAFALLEL